MSLTSLADDVAALGRVLERLDGPVVLAGHAYAGAVIAATRSPKVASLVYVAALAPDEGETVGDVFHRGRPHPKAPMLEPDSHGLVWLPGSAFADAFAQNASSEEQAILAAVQRPLAAARISVPVERPLWKDRPSWFLIAEDDRMIPPDTHRFMAGRTNAHARTRPVDHTPLVTAPEIQLDLFLDYASNVELYPAFQEYFRTRRPPLLAIWGRNDPFFLPAGAEAFKRDIPDADARFLDTDHFALETHAGEIAAATRGFLTG